jgi:peptidoglycan/xylan/chitin deacetylase (PgdA/CDA1 family)
MNELNETVQSSAAGKQELLPDYSDRAKPDTMGAPVERTAVVTYHEILPEDSTYLYRVTSSAFYNHLAYFSLARENSLAGAVPKITFDDGHRSNYENSFPILERFRAKATFFVLAGQLGSNENYISWEQAREMAAAGHQIASHGWSHRTLTQCNPSDLVREVSDSKREIEDRLGIDVDSLSVPGGRWNFRVADACACAGYKYLFHSNPWAPTGIRSGLHLQGRHMVTSRMDSQALRKLLQIGGAERQLLRAKYAAKEQVRQLLGDQLYHKLWCWMANWSPGEGMELEVDGDVNSNGDSKAS